jgi:hypothetical protein
MKQQVQEKAVARLQALGWGTMAEFVKMADVNQNAVAYPASLGNNFNPDSEQLCGEANSPGSVSGIKARRSRTGGCGYRRMLSHTQRVT